MKNILIVEYINHQGISLFNRWFNKLSIQAAAKVTVALYRLELGNWSNVKHLGAGLYEYKLHFGPGYRIYFGKQSDAIVLLLCGGTKKQQNKDITLAKALWNNYKLMRIKKCH